MNLGLVLAIKIFKVTNGRKIKTDIQKEINILKECRNANIVSYYGCCFNNDFDLWVSMKLKKVEKKKLKKKKKKRN